MLLLVLTRGKGGEKGEGWGRRPHAPRLYRGHGPLRPWGALYCDRLEDGSYRGPLPTAAGGVVQV